MEKNKRRGSARNHGTTNSSTPSFCDIVQYIQYILYVSAGHRERRRCMETWKNGTSVSFCLRKWFVYAAAAAVMSHNVIYAVHAM